MKGISESRRHLVDLTLIAYSNATAYTHQVMEIKDINVGMTYNAVHATDALCPELEFVVLQTGTNVSGPIH